MDDTRLEGSVRPVVAQNLVILWGSKGCRIARVEEGACFGGRVRERCPLQALLAHVSRDGAVGGDDVFAPVFVDHALRGFAADYIQSVVFYVVD